ncbi:WhiB family transcriptional regulator [Rhodococcus opacus]|uniref:Transcriptional regulator WhiB n=1 Tax=Rhodococcus opacus TaxID=37919 RepID=A0A1B1KIU0_RHOOP|nr:WhiB family transcriptional regulator [Rhodococcus opacus]ANS32531.1 hypothetical protein R1CP_39740 [Rhodococcus opacus]
MGHHSFHRHTPVGAIQEWRLNARCRPTVEHLFFASDNEHLGDRARRIAAAKEICSNCPVLLECRDFALHHEPNGIWGGLSERDRVRRRAHDQQSP